MIELRRILLVEDSLSDVELTVEALTDCNLANRLDVVNDGVEALDYLLCEGKFSNRTMLNPAVILLDIKMPRMDGIEVLEAIKTTPELKNIPVVMLTSSREEPDLKRCYELGVNAYIVKPVNSRDFFEAVQHSGIFWAILNEVPSERGGKHG